MQPALVLETENASESTSSMEQPHKMVLGNRLLSSSQMEDYASSTSSIQERAKYDKMQLIQIWRPWKGQCCVQSKQKQKQNSTLSKTLKHEGAQNILAPAKPT